MRLNAVNPWILHGIPVTGQQTSFEPFLFVYYHNACVSIHPQWLVQNTAERREIAISIAYDNMWEFIWKSTKQKKRIFIRHAFVYIHIVYEFVRHPTDLPITVDNDKQRTAVKARRNSIIYFEKKRKTYYLISIFLNSFIYMYINTYRFMYYVQT